MQLVLGAGVALLGVGALTGVGLYLASDDNPTVPATVVDDASLPALVVDGVRLHAEVHGPADAPVVVVLHGGPGDDYRALLPLMPLSDTYRLVFYDQRGAGLSQRVPADRLSVDDYLAELDGVIDAHGDRPVHLIGHSWGAMLGAAYVGRHPEKVQSAILVEPGFLTADASRPFLEAVSNPPLSPSLLQHAGWSWLRSLHVDGPDDDAASDFFMLELLGGAPADAHPLGAYFCDRDPTTAHLPHWRFGSTASAAVQSYVQDGAIDLGIDRGLDAYDGPVLLVASGCNTLIGAEHQRTHHLPLFRQGRLEVVQDAGHTLIGEAPDRVVPLFRTFLDQSRAE